MAAMIPEHLFHITPAGNLRSIERYGIDPRKRYPERIGTRSYFVEESQLMWAIAHTSARHIVPVTKLGVLRFAAYPQARVQIFKKIGFLAGVYFTDKAGLMSDYEPLLASLLTSTYEVEGGVLPVSMWQLTEDGGLG